MDTKSILLSAPERHFDESLRAMVREWSEPPTQDQVKAALDACVHAGLASTPVMLLLEAEYLDACAREAG